MTVRPKLDSQGNPTSRHPQLGGKVDPRLEQLFGPADSNGIIHTPAREGGVAELMPVSIFFPPVLEPYIEQLRRAEEEVIRRMMLGAQVDHAVDAFRYATSRMSNAGSYSNGATLAAVTLERIRQAQARVLERFGMPMLPSGYHCGTREHLEYIISGLYPSLCDVTVGTGAGTITIYGTATTDCWHQLQVQLHEQMPVGLAWQFVNHGRIGAFLANRSKWKIARTATTPYMDRLLERWIEISSQDDELVMQVMHQHAFGGELLVDHDRFLEQRGRSRCGHPACVTGFIYPDEGGKSAGLCWRCNVVPWRPELEPKTGWRPI